MGSLLAKFQSNPWLKNMVLLSILAAACAGTFWWGKKQAGRSLSHVPELDPDVKLVGNHDQRVVAYLHTDIPVTRAELGEYLIARFGAERLDFLVNRRIVELEAKKLHIHVSDDEVEARFKRDLFSFNPPLTERDFVNTVLKRFQKNLYEWKEDVIRPKVMMEKIVKSKVVIDEKDVQEGFEARFGPRIDCRMIVLDNQNMSIAHKIHASASKSHEAFLEQAKKQFIPHLAQTEGKVPPIHKHFGDKALEDAAFGLKEGQISNLIELKDKTVVMLMCEKRLPADVSVSLEKVRIKLAEEMKELRVAQRIPEEFAEMRKRANPWSLLNSGGQHQGVPTPVPAYTTSHSKPVEPVNPPPLTPGEPAPKEQLAPPAAPMIPSLAPAPMTPEPKASAPVAPKEVKPAVSKEIAPVVPKDAAPVAPKTPTASPPAAVIPAPAPATSTLTPTVAPPMVIPPQPAPMKK